MDELDIDQLPPQYIGPTWQIASDGQWLLPERTLGWEIAGWTHEYLAGEDDEPWNFTDEQLRFILWWYAVDASGRFTYRTGVLQRMKGWGKDPLLAVLCLVELCGPSRVRRNQHGFPVWDQDGHPVGDPHPRAWVQVTAVNQAQTTNTMALIPSLMTDHFKAAYDVEDGAVLIRAMGGKCRLEAVTSSYRAIEGKRTTFTLMNEALALDTPIPSPSGTKTMGDLVAGDVIYGSDGLPTVVTAAHEVQTGRDCFRVSLPNGDSVVASDGHLWASRPAGPPTHTKVRTTGEMYADGRKFRVPRGGVQVSDDVELPLDPYVLGYWLGDGSTGSCNVTIGRDDEPATVAEFAKRGVELKPLPADEHRSARRFTFSHRRGFGSGMGSDEAKALRGLSCYQGKHIPEEYLRAGTEQRRELLRGLMDSDGCVTGNGSTSVLVGRERLIQDAARLASSLGLLPSVTFQEDPRSRDGGTWRMHFLNEELNPFSMPRKADKVIVRARREWVSISIEKVDSVPVRCISVSADDSLFLAGMAVVTHNTHHWVAGNHGHKMAETIDGNATKQKSRYLAITNAYLPGEDSVAERMRESWEKIQDGRAVDVRFLYDSIEAHEKTPLTPEALRVTIPKIRGDAFWLDVEEIIASIQNTQIAPSRSRRMWLNQVVADEDALYSPHDWDQLADPEIDGLAPGEEVTLGFDGGKTDDDTALVAIRVRDRVAFKLGHWYKPDEWPSGPDAPKWEVDKARVNDTVLNVLATYKVVAFFADVALWESYIDAWAATSTARAFKVKANGNHAIAFDMRGQIQRGTRAHESLMSAVLEGRIKHDGDRALRRHVLNARRRENAYGVSFGKESRESPRKVDLYAALMLAFAAYTDLTVKAKPEKERSGRGYFT